MVALVIGTILLVGASTLIGMAVCTLCGWGASWLAPAVGFALLLAGGGAVQQVPGATDTVAVAVALLALAALALPQVRAGLAQRWREGLPLAVAVGGLSCLPFLVSARAGILGAGDNNDMVQHLTAAYWLGAHIGRAPLLVRSGYPLGPHGLAALLSRGTGMALVLAFDSLTLAIPVITALAALAALPRSLPPVGRQIVAGLVGICYLAASYLALGAFKETAEALALLAFALGLRRLLMAGVRPRWPEGIPLGLIAGGTVYTYSFAGLVWPVAVAGIVLSVTLATHRATGTAAAGLRRRLAGVRAGLAAGVAAVLAGVALMLPQAARLRDFSSSSFNHEPSGGLGNLVHAISPAQTLGVWLRSDYRFHPHPFALTLLLIVLALVVGLGALAWAVRRRDLVLPLSIAAGALIWWQATVQKNVYVQAKALIIPAPLEMLLLGWALLSAWVAVDTRRRRPAARLNAPGGAPRSPRGAQGGALRRMLVVRGVAVVLAAGAGASSLLALRDAPVSASTHAAEVASLRSLVLHSWVLSMDDDDFTHWYLAGNDVGTGPILYPTLTVPPRAAKNWVVSTPFDFDSFPPHQLTRFDYVIEPRSSYRSGTPANFHLVRRTRWFWLWRRSGPTPVRRTLEPAGSPGATLDCASASGRALAAQRGIAAVLPRPVVRTWLSWHGQPVDAGQSGWLSVGLGAGSWDVSLQYSSSTGMDVKGPGLRAVLPATLGRIGPYWLVGTIRLSRPGRATLRVTARKLHLLGRLLGAPGLSRPLDVPKNLPLQGIAFTRHGAHDRRVPLNQACGLYVDWYQVTPSGPAVAPGPRH